MGLGAASSGGWSLVCGGVHAGVYFGMAAEGGRVFVPISDTDDGREYPEPPRPGMYALDLSTGEYLWKAPSENVCREDQQFCHPGYGQAITATPELVIAGSNDGHLYAVDQSTGTFMIRGIFPNPDRDIVPGLFVTVRLPISIQKDALLVPERAVPADMAGRFVLVVNDDNEVERREVTVGIKVGELVVINEGLTANDTVIIDGLQRSRPGAKVDPQPIELTADELAAIDAVAPKGVAAGTRYPEASMAALDG